MTREEAIKELSKLIFELGFEDNVDDKVYALNMAIQALSQKPCGETISRQAVMDCFKKWQPYMATRWYEFKKELSALPSVTQKSGKWIPVSERLPENSGNYLITYCLLDKIETQEAVYIEEEDKWFDITDIEITLAVIAWMPLPKPFEPQKSEE